MQAPKDAIVIDGSEGEGGGQILRTSLALSLITGRPFHLIKLRARRHKPGLLRQHLTAVRAATSVGAAKVQGDALGSQELVFQPGPVKHGEYTFSVGSAGSVTLVLQTVIWPLLHAPGTSTLSFEGGTHNPMAPPFEFIAEVFLPLLRRMGAQVQANLERVGFYPAGGGRFTAKVTGGEPLKPLHWHDRGQVIRRQARAIYANLPKSIADRELRAVQNLLGWERSEMRAIEVESAGPGNALLLSVEFEHGSELFSAFGEKRISAEQVAARVVKELGEHLGSAAPVGPHLADQLLIPLALAGSGSFLSHSLTQHTLTNMSIVRRFLAVEFEVTDAPDGARHVTVRRG
ncbi:RNA 3'-terminal phosphate cyclase [Nannocystis radixulma]|uniref:RNA 3'-terminal phosphate cyclase n=1 Tax=Nannocystis radixulma TaxID=2995305 RepID=A0ABT5B6R8_9BACT|nr:RNA 3'-terminal phosphate cyclase [Nannocystis radixulma]MDC0668721.1 RNA 3'-terminal phosphate cyclase [Nannocystis radixulma]